MWYSEQVQKQLVPINEVKVEIPASVMKNLSANWMMSIDMGGSEVQI